MFLSDLQNGLMSKEFCARMEIAYRFLKNVSPEIELGRHELEEGLFANVQSFDSKDFETCEYESHDRFADVHYLISGQENIAVAERSICQAKTEYDSENDFTLHMHPNTYSIIKLTPGQFLVLMPNEAHLPGFSDEPTHIRKIVVKVPL